MYHLPLSSLNQHESSSISTTVVASVITIPKCLILTPTFKNLGTSQELANAFVDRKRETTTNKKNFFIVTSSGKRKNLKLTMRRQFYLNF